MKVGAYRAVAAALTICLQVSVPVVAEDESMLLVEDAMGLGMPISDAALAENRGGSALQISGMDLDGNLLDNQASSNITGSNFVTESAFSSASGFATVVQNSGNNVIIQSATILNLSVH